MKLEDIVMVNPGTWSKKSGWDTLKYLDTANITMGRIDEIVVFDPNSDKIPSRAKRLVQNGDIVYSMVRPNQMHYGILKQIPKNLVVSTGFVVLRSKFPNDYNTTYIYYLITQAQLTNYLHGIAENNTSAYPSLRPQDILDLEFEFPSIEEQRRTVDFIGTLDDKIEINQKMNQTLEEIAKAIFKSWFVDFDPVRAKAEGRPTGLPPEISALFPDKLVESEIGEIPKGWRVNELGQHTSLTKGRSYKSLDLKDSKVALVTLKSFLRGGGYRHDGLKPYIGKYRDEQVVEAGDLVIALTDVTQAAEVIGKPALVRKSSSYSTLVASLDVGIVRPLKDSPITREFCHQFMLTDRYNSHPLGYTSGTTVLHLSKEAPAKFTFPMPSIELIERITEIISPINARIFHAEKENEVLAEIRDTLLPKLISGELRVPDAEKFLEEAGI